MLKRNRPRVTEAFASHLLPLMRIDSLRALPMNHYIEALQSKGLLGKLARGAIVTDQDGVDHKRAQESSKTHGCVGITGNTHLK